MTDIKQLEYDVADIVFQMQHLVNKLNQKLDKIREYEIKPKPAQIINEKPPELRFLRVKEVATKVSVSVATIWKLVSEGKFPKPKKLNIRTTVWLSTDIDKWIENQ